MAVDVYSISHTGEGHIRSLFSWLHLGPRRTVNADVPELANFAAKLVLDVKPSELSSTTMHKVFINFECAYQLFSDHYSRWSICRPPDCPTGSTEAALEIIATWADSYWGLDLHVIEPGGVEVYHSSSHKLGVSRHVPQSDQSTSTPFSKIILRLKTVAN